VGSTPTTGTIKDINKMFEDNTTQDNITPGSFGAPKYYNSSDDNNESINQPQDQGSYFGSGVDLGMQDVEINPAGQQAPIAPHALESEPALESELKPEAVESLTSEPISYADASVQEVPINLIVPNPYQPRKSFDQNQLQELADSIKEHGVIQPLVVNQTENGYELVVGERRFRASQLAGLVKVPVIVKSGMKDQTKLEVALIENIQRQELNPIEEAQAYEKLMRMFGLTQEKVAQKVGKSRPAIANTVRLLNLPAEIQRGIVERNISEGHARAILGLTGVERQLALYKMILEQGLNVRQVEAKVRELMARPRLEAAGPDPKTLAIETELRNKLGTKVKIEKKGRGGKIMIEFFSEEELEELLDKFSGQEEQGKYFVV
jgi:ParB family transcriptional regulator, chromosome partitioning protein